ncbi:hypothetical protein C0Q70_06853 [Pomacea canaliculata]|uniref:Sulfotransferase domain-containing protein n=1 Tax=Pomacea canaliculata TaxID=400727 RepID=A0A2T7PDF4_POMCA|nr:sulfotransferase family cytosolic 1B member 1-like [Pomacea canaliculata]XP_025092239.1 sulfotransferase family cytosolic 1B member 1-like [Pomacea canaliculata]PVD31441.1 hypothetical protein C0Q70_06853 [Pomacea canaliculata]
MTSILKEFSAKLRIKEKTPVDTCVEEILDKEEEPYEKAGLHAVEICDGNGCPMNMRDAHGLLLSRNVPPDVLARKVTFKARNDDVLLITYPKSGTHWLWEVVSMLTRGSTTLLSDTMTHIDYFPLEVIDILPSPRVLATHMPVTQVPRDFFTRRCKMILCVRNPWDVALSFFHFVRNLQTFEYSGEWDGFFDLFLQGNVPYSSWFEHSREWLDLLSSNTNILLVLFEDMHKDLKQELARIARFLDVPMTNDLAEAIQRETTFTNMAKNKFDYTIAYSKTGVSPIFRKGKVGDSKNWFTDSQASLVEMAYHRELGENRHKLNYVTRQRTSQ